MDRGGILGRNPGREQREDYKDGNQHHSRGREGIVAGVAGNRAAERDGGGRHTLSYNYHISSWNVL